MVFSGIVEEKGIVREAKYATVTLWDGTKGDAFTLKIESKAAVEEAYIGCSIAVNGACMTAVALDGDLFTVNVAPESLSKTNLGILKAGDLVNVERSMKQSDRISGHCVQGHVDCTGPILDYKIDGDSLRVRIGAEELIAKGLIVPKGYICVDGASLTVVEVNRDSFTLMLIAHTQQVVTLPLKNVGDRVNLEADCMGKYAVASFDGLFRHRIETLERDLSRIKMMAAAALTISCIGCFLVMRRL